MFDDNSLPRENLRIFRYSIFTDLFMGIKADNQGIFIEVQSTSITRDLEKPDSGIAITVINVRLR